MSPPGGCGNAQTASQGVLSSLFLQKGGLPEKIYSILDGTTCPKQYGFGEKRVSSCTDAMIEIMRYHQERVQRGDFILGEPPEEMPEKRQVPVNASDVTSNINNLVDEKCPECGGPVRYSEGCTSCTKCTWNRCG